MALPTSLKRRLIDNLPRVTYRATAVVPDNGQAAIFTVSNANCLVYGLYGRLTVAMDATACNMSVRANPTDGADLNITAATAVANTAQYVMVSMSGIFTQNINLDGAGAAEGLQASPFIVAPGTIDLLTTATQTGSIEWWIRWTELGNNGGAITAA